MRKAEKLLQWWQEPLDEEEGIKAVHEAFRSGINYFDTSPYYGDLRSERVSSHCIEQRHACAACCKHLLVSTICWDIVDGHLQVLGRALKDLPREEIFVATKVGRYGSDTFDFSAERVTKSVHESLDRLQV